MRLNNASKAIVRNIVGRYHVSMPVNEIMDIVSNKITKKATPAFIGNARKYAAMVHRENISQYNWIMGRIK